MNSNDDNSTKSLFGIGSWMRKKRYEDEDFSLSPPSEDAGFYHYQFGSTRKASKQPESMFDRINKELNLSAETPKKEVTPEYSEVGSSCGSLRSSSLFGPGKISPNKNSNLPFFIDQTKDVPRILVPQTILEKGESLKSDDLSQEISLEILKTRPEFSRVAFEDAETLIRKARPGRATRKISMNLDNTIDRSALISNFNVENKDPIRSENSSKSEAEQQTLIPKKRSPSPGTTAIQSPFIKSLTVPKGIEGRRRKISAPPNLNPMDRTSNFFFTGGLFSSVPTSKASTTSSSETAQSVVAQSSSTSVISSQTSHSEPVTPMRQRKPGEQSLEDATSKMEIKDQQEDALAPKPKKAWNLRPKPSALREMNMWAPQST